jgi:branched-chain amino acid aminotransferase
MTKPADQYCWLNGNYVPLSQANVPIDDPSFLRGEGLFETIRVREGCALFVGRHWARLERASRGLHLAIPIALDKGSFGAICRWLPRENETREGKIRFTVSAKTALATIEPYEPPKLADRKPLRLVVSPGRIHSSWIVAGAKSTSCAGWTAAKHWAMRHGFDDAILANERDEATETSRSNLFFATASGALVAPPLRCGLLPGVAREAMLEAIQQENPTDAREAPLPLLDLPTYPAAFATNVVRGVEPIGAIAFEDGREVRFEGRHAAIERAQALWERLCAAEAARARVHWGDVETRG